MREKKSKVEMISVSSRQTGKSTQFLELIKQLLTKNEIVFPWQEYAFAHEHLMSPTLLKSVKCVACGHDLDSVESFPEGYPKDKRLCCSCLCAYCRAYLRLGINDIPTIMSIYSMEWCLQAWNIWGSRILEVLKIR